MTAIELQEQKDEAQGDLREQIHGVRLEVEKVCTEMVSQVGGLEMRVCDRIGEVEMRVCDRMGEVEARLSDRISGVEKHLCGWLVIGMSILGALIALVGVLG